MTSSAVPSASPARHRSRGAALLAAMLTVTMVATLAASALWQQWRDVEIETSERARVQAGWMLTGALDWSRLILREDARANSRSGQLVDSLSEPWAVPLQEARLSSFLAADQNNTLDGSDDDDVFLSGAITDAQALFNLRNLVLLAGAPGQQPGPTDGSTAPGAAAATSAPPAASQPTVDPKGLRILQRLCAQLNLPEQQAQLIAQGMLSATLGGDNATLLPLRLEEIAWFGVAADTIRTLAPYATILPIPTPVNLNTAPAPTLAAVLDVSASTAQRIIAARTNMPFRNLEDARKVVGTELELDNQLVAFASSFFEVRGRLRLQQAVVEERSLVRRDPPFKVTTVWRERGALP